MALLSPAVRSQNSRVRALLAFVAGRGMTDVRGSGATLGTSEGTPFQVVLHGGGPVAVKKSSQRATVRMGYEVLVPPESSGQKWDESLQVCLSVLSTLSDGTEKKAGPFCAKEPKREDLVMNDLFPGIHRVTAAVRAADAAATTPLSDEASATWEVLVEEPFLPSWDWQRVLPWQSVPPGLEISLPLDGSGKTARIPPVWRLQLWIEHNGGFYYRGEVSRWTKMSEIRRQIAADSRLGLQEECVVLHLGGAELAASEMDASVADLRLFERSREFSCSIEPWRAPPAEVAEAAAVAEASTAAAQAAAAAAAEAAVGTELVAIAPTDRK